MKVADRRSARITPAPRPGPPAGLLVAVALSVLGASLACTVAVITDGRRVLFCNTEDWTETNSRVWFVPSTTRYGCVYVGFAHGWAQGGMNVKGLAFDGVAGIPEKWEHDGEQEVAPRRSAERMLESCATVAEAIAYYERHWEPAFVIAKFLVADRSGASAVIGARDGRLLVERSTQGATLGFHAPRVATLLAETPDATLPNAVNILRAAQRTGKYGTKYSNIFDLTSGEIHFPLFTVGAELVTLNLADELAKGAHYYDLPDIIRQLQEPPRPLEKSDR